MKQLVAAGYQELASLRLFKLEEEEELEKANEGNARDDAPVNVAARNQGNARLLVKAKVVVAFSEKVLVRAVAHAKESAVHDEAVKARGWLENNHAVGRVE